MSKIKELFGVEIGEEFDIKEEATSSTGNWGGCYFDEDGQLKIQGVSYGTPQRVMGALLIDKAEIIKYKEPILTNEEREYLRAVSNPNFMAGTIIGYFRHQNRDGKYFVEIITTCTNHDCRIYCTSDKSFEGMNEHEIYTPEKLGL